MQREIVQVTCDGCKKTTEVAKLGELPDGWKKFTIAEEGMSSNIHFDVCSSGCGENYVIKLMREFFPQIVRPHL